MPATLDPTTAYILIAVAAVVLLGIIVVVTRRNRSAQLQRRFGPEYDRTIGKTGSRTAAERELAAREARVKKLHIVELPKGARERYLEEWRSVQTRFVDEPPAALTSADVLVTSVMRDRGYPMDNFDQQVADLSTDHPKVLDNYRAAHEIAVRNEARQASTEDLRQAMVHYRSLFEDLVGTSERNTP